VSTETIYGACPLDCPDACSWVVTVEDGVPIKLRGRKDHPFTQGGLCVKVNPYLKYAASDDRLLTPMRRIGTKGQGRFTPISWNDALAEMAERLQTAIDGYGPESIWPFAGTGSMGHLQGWPGAGQRLWNHLGTSTHNAPPICSLTGHIGMSYTAGQAYGMDPEHLAQSALVILWGTNTLTTNQHLWPFIQRAKGNGAPVVVIDPIRTRTADRADLHLAPIPGTDAALAFGLINRIVASTGHDTRFLAEHCLGWDEFHDTVITHWTLDRTSDVTGVDVSQLEKLAELICANRPTGIRFLMGMQRHAGGGQAARAISCIPAVTGDYRYLGGGAVYSTGPAYKFNIDALNATHLRTQPARSLAMTRLGEGLLDLNDPPIKALIISGANPVVSNPDQNRTKRGLEREDLFTVVIEHRQTDTADYADLLLPSTMQTEHLDIHDSYTHLYVQWNNPAVPPRAEALPHTEIFRRLAKALDLTEPALQASDDELAEALLDSDHPNLTGITTEQLRVDGYARLTLPEDDQPFAEGFPTTSGLFEFRSDRAATAGHGAYPTYTPPAEATDTRDGQLALIAAASHDQLNSTFAESPLHKQHAQTVTVHPDDAERLGLTTTKAVAVSNSRGTFTAILQINRTTRPGVAAASKGPWAKHEPTVNAVTAEADADMGRGATYHDNLVTLAQG